MYLQAIGMFYKYMLSTNKTKKIEFFSVDDRCRRGERHVQQANISRGN